MKNILTEALVNPATNASLFLVIQILQSYDLNFSKLVASVLKMSIIVFSS